MVLRFVLLLPIASVYATLSYYYHFLGYWCLAWIEGDRLPGPLLEDDVCDNQDDMYISYYVW